MFSSGKDPLKEQNLQLKPVQTMQAFTIAPNQKTRGKRCWLWSSHSTSSSKVFLCCSCIDNESQHGCQAAAAAGTQVTSNRKTGHGQGGLLLTWLSLTRKENYFQDIPLRLPSNSQTNKCHGAGHPTTQTHMESYQKKGKSAFGIATYKSVTQAQSRSRERRSGVQALLILSTVLVKKSPEKKSEVWKQDLMFSQKGMFSITSCANCSMRSQTGISYLQEAHFGYCPMRNHLQLLPPPSLLSSYFNIFLPQQKARLMTVAAELRHPHEGGESHHCVFLQSPGAQHSTLWGECCTWREMSQRQM